MNILVAPDKFRGSLEATEVCAAVEQGVLLAFPDARVTSVPLADGGEGTAAILTQYADGQTVFCDVQDPLGRAIRAGYGISSDGKTAFIEMAAASGLALLAPHEHNPLLTSTFGTGQLILDALNRNVSRIVIGIGGSATTDVGIGMAAALGFDFFDQSGSPIEPVGGSLSQIFSIDKKNIDKRIASVTFTVACDVKNPLFGPQGAAVIYGPQKGADMEMVQQLDAGLEHFSGIASVVFDKNISDTPGAGAAGGLGAGCLWFLNAELRHGVSIVMEYANLGQLIKKADLVITGEGKVDEQTLSGKVVKGLADMCRKYNVPLAVVCGTLQISPGQTHDAGITYAVSVLDRPMTLAQAEKDAAALVQNATFQLVRLFFANRE